MGKSWEDLDKESRVSGFMINRNIVFVIMTIRKNFAGKQTFRMVDTK